MAILLTAHWDESARLKAASQVVDVAIVLGAICASRLLTVVTFVLAVTVPLVARQNGLMTNTLARTIPVGSILAALFSLAGATACALPAVFMGAALSNFPGSDCQPEIGTGCDGNNVFLTGVLFLAVYFPWTVGSYALTQLHRRQSIPLLKWWPFTLQVSVPIILAVGAAITSS